MKYFTLLIGFLVVLVPCSVPWADNLVQGFHGMKWGSSINAHKNLVQVHAKGSTAYYSNADAAYQISGTQIANVIYGFYQDQLFAAFIKLKTHIQFSN